VYWQVTLDYLTTMLLTQGLRSAQVQGTEGGGGGPAGGVGGALPFVFMPSTRYTVLTGLTRI
jgi:hypothetical protein